MKVGVPKETAEGEKRVALVPDVIRRLTAGEDSGIEIVIESGAGEGSDILDSDFEEAGATIGDASAAWGAEVVVKVQPPTSAEVGGLRRGQVLIAHLEPLASPQVAQTLAQAGVTSFAMESIPRTTRAQAMDALSSQANLAGYVAVILAGAQLNRIFPMMTTAAGTVQPAKVLVLGAGVAGLQAIATAKRLGAVVTGFDVRTEVREQVQSLGAKFLEIDVSGGEGEGGYAKELDEEQQRKIKEGVSEAATRNDVVITTAQIPGRPAPKLISAEGIAGMRPGSVIVDLAGATGGNTDLTEAGQTVVRENVTIVSELNLPSRLSGNASQLYAQNINNFLALITGEGGALNLNFEDDIVRDTCLTHEGEIRNERTKQLAGQAQ